MAHIHSLTASFFTMLLVSAPLVADSIRNWTAPRFWTPPRIAELEKKRSQVVGTLGLESVPTGPLPFFGITPCRVADTRGNGFAGQYGPPQLTPAGRTITIINTCGIPATAQAVSFNFSAVNVAGAGFFVAYPAGGAFPPVATMTYNQNTPNLSNAAVVPLGTGGAITVVAAVIAIDLVIDVNGYYAPASSASSKTVAVDCTMGQSLQAAINREDGPLVIDVNGICNENVTVIRKDVTLRGSDPLTDGIQGVVAVPQFPALRFRYVDSGRVENFSISNGPGPGMAAVFSHLTLVNCRVTGNGGAGMVVTEGSFADATGLTVSQNTGQGANVQRGAIFFCQACDFVSNGGFAAAAGNGGFLTLLNTVVTGRRGLSSNAGYADIDCISFISSHPCSLQATGQAAVASDKGTAVLFGAGDFTGQLQTDDRGSVQLFGARQLATGQPGQGPLANGVGTFGTLVAGTDDVGQSQLFGTTVVSGFGRALLSDATTLSGSIQCNSAGDAWLDPTIVKGPGAAISGCEHGVLPP
jgi:hypothetical protein